jgi:predicted HAD superfamily Cof-like phosphohydrolase
MLFKLVTEMNEAFGNPKGDPKKLVEGDKELWERLSNQCDNIGDEFVELKDALADLDIDATRDALCDIIVFALGAFHLVGIDANKDMQVVVDAVMSRFVKDTDDLSATLKILADKGVHEIAVEGEYPRKIVRSAANQPDAPKGKFLKSASYFKPKFSEL